MTVKTEKTPDTDFLRLRYIRDQLDLTRGEFARLVGVAETTVASWENGQNPLPAWLLNGLRIRGVSSRWLRDGKGEPFLTSPDRLKESVRLELADEESALKDFMTRPMKRAGLAETASVDDVQFAREFSRIPLLNVRASAGPGADVGEEREIVKMAFRTEWLRRELRTSNPEEDFALITAEGDSMEPSILGGDILLVDTRQKIVGSGGVYVIRQADALSVKRLQRTPSGAVRIISDNPRYESFEVAASEHDGFEIKGRVVWLGRKI